MNHHATNIIRSLFILCFAGSVFAGSTVTIDSFNAPSFSGNIIASDSYFGGSYNRDALRLTAAVSWQASPSTSYDFELRFSLIDNSNGNPVQVYDASNNPAAYYTETRSFGSLGLPIGTFSSIGLKPVNQLDHTRTYTPRLEIFEVGAGGFPTIPTSKALSTLGPQTIHHFPSLNSSDSEVNVHTTFTSAAMQSPVMLATSGQQFEAAVQFQMWRYDGFFNALPTTDTVTLKADLVLRDSNGTVIPLANNAPTFSVSMASFVATNPKTPASALFNETVSFKPSNPAGLSFSESYELEVSLSHLEGGSYVPAAASHTTPASPLRYLSGNLYFGAINTTLSAIQFLEVPGTPSGADILALLIPGAGAGSLPSGHTYGNGSAALQVLIKPNGDAYFTGNAPGESQVPLKALSLPDQASIGNLNYTRSGLYLDNGGAHGQIEVCLPAGLGYTFNPADKLLQHTLTYNGTIDYNSGLQPVPASLNFVLPSQGWFAEETKPLLFGTFSITWTLASGTITLLSSASNDILYVRRDELDYLDAQVGLSNSDGPLKRSNEQYWRKATQLPGMNIVINTDANGTALLDVDVELLPGAGHNFKTHFPYDASITWNDNSQVTIDDDRIDPTTSVLKNVAAVTLPYSRDCGEGDCGDTIGAAIVTGTANSGDLIITEEGGLVAETSLAASTDLTWAYISALSSPGTDRFTHTAFGFTKANVAIAGHFLRGSDSAVSDDRGASSILLSGASSLGMVSERLGHGSYLQGAVDYPGFNFYVVNDGDHDGKTILAGNLNIPIYPLTNGSKYYTRFAGVSGIHQAMNGTFLPPDIYGFNMSFDVFGLSYLDSAQIQAVTWGNLAVPYPSDFNLAFSNIQVDCVGGLNGADIGGNGGKILSYWNGDFTPLAMAFAKNPGQACNPADGSLALDAVAYMSHVSQPFYGTLGFHSDGNLITPADNLAGLTSRLNGPNRISFAGPEGETYRMDVVSSLFYNNYDLAGPAEGFLNIAGRLDVPFFQDVKVHLQTRGDKESQIAPLHLMGGWPSHGYEIAGQNFFSLPAFDNDHKGFAGATLDGYRNSGNENYLPRAQQNWLGIVNFDYPMVWSDFERRFTSYGEHKNKFLIVDVEHDLPMLSANQAELTFGASWDGIPQLSLAGLAGELVDDQLMRPFRAAVDEGKDALATMLDDKVSELLDPVLDRILDPVMDDLYDGLYEAYLNGIANAPVPVNINELLPFSDWLAYYQQTKRCYITGEMLDPTPPYNCYVDTAILEALRDVIGEVDDVSSLLSEIDKYLEKTELVLDAFTSSFKDPEGRILSDTNGMFVCDESGNLDFTFAQELVKRLVQTQDLGVDPALIAQAVDNLLQPLLEDKTPTLKKLAEKLLKLKTFISQVRTYLGSASEFVSNLQDQLMLMDAELTNVVNTFDTAVVNFFQELESLSTIVGSPFTEYTKEEFKTMMKTELKDAFYSSPVGTKLQNIIKQNLFDTNGAICQGIDSVFASLNDVIKDLLNDVFQELDKKIIPFLDKLNDVIGAGELSGYAHIVGDAIRYARMDAHLEWSVPEKMDFDGFIEIKQLNAEGSGNACYANTPGVINEVTLGANHVPLNWISDGVKADIWGKATFDTTPNQPLELLGVGGGFEMVEGQIKFEKFLVTELGAAISFGEKEAYLAAKAHAVFDNVEAGIGAFFGKTCTIEPLAMVDADVASVIGQPPFTGAYLYGEAWIPIFNYGCPLRVSAGAGIGLGYFVEGPTWIGKMKLGVSGEAICIVSVRGELTLIGVKQGSDFRFKGTGTISGSVGKCKWFCIKFKKSITVEK